ncbi:MAG: rhodanese-like domain-containing protein [Bacteroidota bacterium]
MKTAIASPGCIAPGDVKKRRQAGETVQIIDVRSSEEFEERHIPEAIHLPLDALENSASLFDRTAILVTACGKGGGRSAKGAEILRQLGFRSTWLCGGTFGWIEGGTDLSALQVLTGL